MGGVGVKMGNVAKRGGDQCWDRNVGKQFQTCLGRWDQDDPVHLVTNALSMGRHGAIYSNLQQQQQNNRTTRDTTMVWASSVMATKGVMRHVFSLLLGQLQGQGVFLLLTVITWCNCWMKLKYSIPFCFVRVWLHWRAESEWFGFAAVWFPAWIMSETAISAHTGPLEGFVISPFILIAMQAVFQSTAPLHYFLPNVVCACACTHNHFKAC